MNKLKPYFLDNIEKSFIFLILVSVTFISYFIYDQLAVLHFYYLVIIAAGYFLGQRTAILFAFFIILLVWILVLANQASFLLLYEELQLKSNLTIWGGFLILSGWVGSLSQNLKKELEHTKSLLLELDQKRKLLAEANKKLIDHGYSLEAKLDKQNIAMMSSLAELQKLAKTDPLTGLLNRRGMTEQIDREILRLKRYKRAFTLGLGDIDNFKKINETFGHDAGDYILVEMAKIIIDVGRSADMFCRWGGKEFMVLLPETDLEGGGIFVEKIRSRIEKHTFNFNGASIMVTVSFGISVCDNGSSTEQYIKEADQCLYLAKQTGKNKVISKLSSGSDGPV